jgi:paraquat-inducible protein B
LKLADLASVQ